MNSIEPLEQRIAPASVISYTDIDGDLVKITASKGTLDETDLTLSNLITEKSTLQILDLNDDGFEGANITFSVTKSADGDGLAHVGRIFAINHNLGTVTVKGDLASIDVGDGTGVALQKLSVHSMGRYDRDTQSGGPDMQSNIEGSLGALVIAGDFTRVSMLVSGVDSVLGSISIGGSINGGETINPTNYTTAGNITVEGSIGSITVKGDIIGGINDSTGSIVSWHEIGAVTVGGSIKGGAGMDSGAVISGFTSTGDMGPVKIGRDLIGGTGQSSGKVVSLHTGDMASVTIGGSIYGGDGSGSGLVFSDGDLGPVKVRRDVVGGNGGGSGRIVADGTTGGVTVGGNLIGGEGFYSGQIASFGNQGFVQIGGDVIGGASEGAGRIWGGAKVAGVRVGGSVVGGEGDRSGELGFTEVGAVHVGGDLIGGDGVYSGRIRSNGPMGPVTIGESVLGGGGHNSGQIWADGKLGAVKIGGDLRGGSITGNESADRSGYIEGKSIASVTIGGSIIAGIDASSGSLTKNASIRAVDDIGPIVVKDSLIGNVSNFYGKTEVVISARGQHNPTGTTDVAIKSLTVGGRVELATIRAGFGVDDTSRMGSNGNAQIGAVTVGEDWIASSILAGVRDTRGGPFGAPYSVISTPAADATLSKIASIQIKGSVIGTSLYGDGYVFAAQHIGSFKSLGFVAALTAAKDVPMMLARTTGGDVVIREV